MKYRAIYLFSMFAPLIAVSQGVTTGRIHTKGYCNSVSIGNTAPVTRTGNCQVVIQNQASLYFRTQAVARQILDFINERDGVPNSYVGVYETQAFMDALNETHDAETFQIRLHTYNLETQRIFDQKYFPRVLDLEEELSRRKVDVSPINRAVSLASVRRIGFALSAAGERLLKEEAPRKPTSDMRSDLSCTFGPKIRIFGDATTFGSGCGDGHVALPRSLSLVAAQALLRGAVLPTVEVYAETSDPNSLKVANVLLAALKQMAVKTDTAVHNLDHSPNRHGINLIYPSADWTTIKNPLIPGFEEAELECTWEIQRTAQPPSILKIEVRPQTDGWTPPRALSSLIVQHPPQ